MPFVGMGLSPDAPLGAEDDSIARQCGIKDPTFAAWLAKRMKEGLPLSRSADRPAFVLAERSGDAANDRAHEVRLPGGAVARVTDAARIRLLFRPRLRRASGSP